MPKLYYQNDRAFVKSGFNSKAWQLFRAMPGAKWHEEQLLWEVSADLKDRETILKFCDKMSIEVPDNFRNFSIPRDVLEILKNAKTAGAYNFQLDGIYHLAMKNKAILGDDMGLGKTVQALLALPRNEKVLIATPSNPKYNWEVEAKRWRPDYDIRVVEGRGVSELRLQLPPREGEIVIMNYDILPGNKRDLGEDEGFEIVGIVEKMWKDIIFIADEAHYMKNRDSVRHKKGKILSRLAKKTWLLTGTPMLGYPDDLWGLLVAGGMHEICYGDWENFKTLFNYRKGEVSRNRRWGMPTLEGSARLLRAMLRRNKREVLDLPEKQRHDIQVTGLPEHVKAKLDELYDDFWYMLDDNRLPPFHEMAKVRNQLAIARTEAAIEVVEKFEANNNPLIVFSAHRFPVDEIGKRDGWKTITGDTSSKKKQEIVEQFQNGNLKGVAATITAGNEGITLTNANNILFVDLDWTPSNNWQAEDRINRIGQNAESLNVIRLVSSHAMDRKVLDILTAKIQRIEKAINLTLPEVHNYQSI